MNKVILYVVLVLVGCATARAQSNFVGNPYLPYPASCAFVPDGDAHDWLQTHAVRFDTRTLRTLDSQSGEWIEVEFAAYRGFCSEPGRAPVWLEFSLRDSPRRPAPAFRLPSVSLLRQGEIYVPLHLAEEPGGWALGEERESDAIYLSAAAPGTDSHYWVFLLENRSPFSEWWGYYPYVTAEEYNAAFELVLHLAASGSAPVISVPASVDLFPQPAMALPLSGRLSGTWVIEGAADQGFVLSISDRVAWDRTDRAARENPPLVAFLAHYTFDAQGNPLWLTGVGEFAAGVNQVSLEMIKITSGQFRGAATGTREVIGSVTLRANSCDDVRFDYDYERLGLGSGTKRMQRLYSLEVAGYECQDYEARVAANR